MKTKTLVIIISIICLLFAVVTAALHVYETPTMREPSLDYEALGTVYPADKTIGRINGKDVTWGNYSNYFIAYAQQIEYYFAQLKEYYGVQMNWNDEAEEGTKYIDVPKQYAEENLKDDYVFEKLAEQNGVTYNPDDSNGRYNVFYAMYGENGEKISDEDSIKYLEDNGYMHVMHILYMTVDMDTYEDLPAEEMSKKEAAAKAIAEELQAIDDKEERASKFKEYMEEFSEDTGKALYSDGYTFTEGTMVQEFYDGSKALKEYEVSDPVKSAYGYHVIIRLPLDPDADISSDTGEGARLSCAYNKFNSLMDELLKGVNFEYADGFKLPDIQKYIY